jgi:hypothetical protein
MLASPTANSIMSWMMHRYDGDRLSIKPIEEAEDAYEATGIWWAQFVLEAALRHAEFVREHMDDPVHYRHVLTHYEQIEDAAGGFSRAVTDVAIELERTAISVTEMLPDQVLREAAIRARMVIDEANDFLPNGSATGIINDCLWAKIALNKPEKVWPPEA